MRMKILYTECPYLEFALIGRMESCGVHEMACFVESWSKYRGTAVLAGFSVIRAEIRWRSGQGIEVGWSRLFMAMQESFSKGTVQ
jgi:hypothetical protein